MGSPAWDTASAMAELANEARAAGSMDSLRVGVHVGGRQVGGAPLAAWRFEGRVNPEAYLGGPGGALQILHSPWAETFADAWAALKLLRANRSRARRVVRRKQRRFRVGRAWAAEHRPHSYFRSVALNVSGWVRSLRDAGIPLSGSFVNLGANDGVSDDPLYGFATESRDAGLAGPTLAVEAEPSLCERHRANLPWVRLACTTVTPQNAAELLRPAFPTPAARDALDVLKLDLDSFEAFVLEECLRAGLRPKLLLVEVNAGIPPPLQYALLDSPQLRARYPEVQLSMRSGEKQHVFEVNKPLAGVSLSYLARRLAPDYLLLEFGSPDAIFARADVLQALRREPLDEFKAYEFGWVDVHGFSRQQLRRWYFDLDEVAALGEVHDFLVGWAGQHLGALLPFVLSY